MQLHELEIGRLAYQAKVNSVMKYNLSSSSERALGLPTDCITSIAADVINNNNSSSSAAVFCHECSSSDDSAESDAEQRGGDSSRHRSREKELKDYAYSKALVDFKVVACVRLVIIFKIYKINYYHLSPLATIIRPSNARLHALKDGSVWRRLVCFQLSVRSNIFGASRRIKLEQHLKGSW